MVLRHRDTPFVVREGGAADISAGALAGAVVAIGNFDGVHRGHHAVIASASARASALGRPAAALTFEPHPRTFFRPQQPVFRLSDRRAKLRLLAGTELDGALSMTFDAALSGISAEDFVAEILVGRFGIGGAVIGYDFHFGKKRLGSPEFLTAEGARRGFTVDIVPPLQENGKTVSSGVVREALIEGDVARAASLLGAPWFVSGEVVHGEKRGRELGFPTANLKLDPACALKHGIYAVRVGIGDALHDGVASFGRRPTFDNGAPLLEIFLFDFSGDLYGREIDVAFLGWLRGEAKFDNAEALTRQMQADAAQARDVLAREPGAFPILGEI
jgi:riboflavin kinase/FMN adenylyltransferase